MWIHVNVYNFLVLKTHYFVKYNNCDGSFFLFLLIGTNFIRCLDIKNSKRVNRKEFYCRIKIRFWTKEMFFSPNIVLKHWKQIE